MTDVYDGHLVTLGGQLLTGIDPFGVEWKGIDLGGWYGAAGTSLASSQKTRGPGAWRGAAPQYTAKAIPLTGQLEAATPDAARDAVDRLNAAVDLSGSLLVVTVGSLTRHQIVTQSDEPLPKFETDVVVTWSIGVTALDPRKLGDTLNTSTSAGGQASLTNPGNTTGRVVVTLTGPCTSPGVTHVQSGLTVQLSGLQLNAGQSVTIDMEAQTVLDQDGASAARNVTTRGWSAFVAGTNTWTFLASSPGSGTQMSVAAVPSWR